MSTPLPSFATVLQAAARLRPHARLTPVLRSAALDALSGAELHFKAEPLQLGGAFKFRGASNAVWALDTATAERGVLTHSSGNHGTALAAIQIGGRCQASDALNKTAVRVVIERHLTLGDVDLL